MKILLDLAENGLSGEGLLSGYRPTLNILLSKETGIELHKLKLLKAMVANSLSLPLW